MWVVEQQVEPLQLIVQDDEDGGFARIPVTVAADDTITFGPAVNVKRIYVDAPPDVEGCPCSCCGPMAMPCTCGCAMCCGAPGISASHRHVVFASRQESRPGTRPPQIPHATVASGPRKPWWQFWKQ